MHATEIYKSTKTILLFSKDDEMIKLYDGENDELVGYANDEQEAVGLITKFLQENCSGMRGISDLEIEANYTQRPTLAGQCRHYNFYFCNSD